MLNAIDYNENGKTKKSKAFVLFFHRLQGIIFSLLISVFSLSTMVRAQTGQIAGFTDESVQNILKNLSVLAADSLQGRGTGSPGIAKARNYLVNQLKAFGVTPLGKGKDYLQKVPMHGSDPLPGCDLKLYDEDSVKNMILWRDYLLYNGGSQTFIPQPLELVFAGYGIIAPEYDYDDYRYINVENKIVVFLSGEPYSDDDDYFAGQSVSHYSDPAFKQRIALSRGAMGTIMIPLPRENNFMDWDYWVSQFKFEDVRLPYGVPDNFNILLRFNSAGALFADALYSFDEILEQDKKGTIRSFQLETKITFRGEFKDRDFTGYNVVGMVPGSDPILAKSYIIVSAHYDHLGIGEAVQGDSIYNGAIDNGIGSSAALEIARVMMKAEPKPHRSVIFLFVTGEEKGLLGSRYYCDHPLVPLSHTVADVNIDGIAIFDRFKNIIGVGAELSTLEDELKIVGKEMHVDVSSVPPIFLSRDPIITSDQYSFALAGIPSILIMEGQNYEHLSPRDGLLKFIDWGNRIYHSPFDDLRQPMDRAAIKQHVEIITKFVYHIANTYIEPQWLPGTRFINARLQSIAEER